MKPDKPLLLDKDHFDLQFQFAQEMRKRTKEPLLEALHRYTFLFKPWNDSTDRDFERGLNYQNAVRRAHEQYLSHMQHATNGINDPGVFGCFHYDLHGDTVKMHFTNRGSGEALLSGDALNKRRQELKEMFTEIRERYPDARYVEGVSWMHNLDAYESLFPKSYTESAEPFRDEEAFRWNAVWGQFRDSEMHVKKKLADSFLAKLKESKDTDPFDALPLPPLKVRGEIDDFYELYGIE